MLLRCAAALAFWTVILGASHGLARPLAFVNASRQLLLSRTSIQSAFGETSRQQRDKVFMSPKTGAEGSALESSIASSADDAEARAGGTESPEEDGAMMFGRFRIAPSQIFFRSPTSLTFAMVNLRPIVPGHVLVISNRVVPHLKDLTDEEHDDLWRSVRTVQSALEGHYGAGGFNVAVQDGRAAGQSVPHVHVHLLPRVTGDFERNDDIYDEIEKWAPREAPAADKQSRLDVPDDEDRRDRTVKEMEEEAAFYRKLFIEG